ncbi:capsular exopolysaccharide synthesis family protein [Yoonia maricola]|uniref:non-specific protein-tyrosine kinase n=1 Tax=Yoonia maricola TaxID=420999 RepID=A0A2M8W0D7_9RHOB|nr:polysaccharide biosynthesis tyrosine autokinase [Yoonia maricola]PJI84388.1 capsular exopolysaccharide synthesis family protein [Yoonia maricola]
MIRDRNDLLIGAQKVAPSGNDEIDLGALLRTLWRGKLWIILCSLIALAAGGYYALFLATPLYTTTASVALESRQEQVVDIESVMSGLSGDQVTINTEVEVLRSRRLIGKVVDDLNLVADPDFNATLRDPPWLSLDAIGNVIGRAATSDPIQSDQAIRDAVINAVLEQITVSNVRQSYVFNISVVTGDPVKSAQIANKLAELYVEDQIVLKFEKTAEATEWLTERVADLQIELETSESQLKDFSSNTDLISPEGLIALNRQLKDLRDRQVDVAAAAATHRARVAELNAARAANDPAQMATIAADARLDQLMTDDDPEAFQQRFEEVLARAIIESNRSEAQQEAIALSILELTDSIQTQSDELVALQQLQRETEASRLIYEFFLSRLKETSVQQGLQQAESRILSSAVMPHQPSAPRKTLILVFSLVLGVIGGAGLVLLREVSQNTFRTPEDLEERTGYAVCGQIPLVPARDRKKVLQYLQDKPNSAVAEAVRNLRTSLLLANLDKPPKVIMSTSSVPGEGKTTQSTALALNLAGLGKKVLLIEGDIRRRVMNTYFDVPEQRGFLSVMLGETTLDEAVTHIPDMHFDVLFGEKSQTNAADIFSSDRFGAFVDELRDRYDYIIIDTPPVLAVADARIIGRWVDTIIYTVRWDHTSRRQVMDGLRSFEQVNVKVSGLVLGQISDRGMKRYGYGESYGAYQTYYDA